jgi:hypothetical protein
MAGDNDLRIRLGNVAGVDWGVTMVRGLIKGEQGEWTDRVMISDL